jgi:hypothetical protein
MVAVSFAQDDFSYFRHAVVAPMISFRHGRFVVSFDSSEPIHYILYLVRHGSVAGSIPLTNSPMQKCPELRLLSVRAVDIAAAAAISGSIQTKAR